MNNIKSIFLSLMLLTALACSEDEDRMSPIAEVVTPANGTHYYRGENIFLNAVFSDDNSGLKKCSIDVVGLKALKGWDDPWTPETEVIDLAGLNKEVKDHIIFNGAIPLDIMSGNYVLNFRVEDQEGNLAQFSRQIYIE